MTKPLYTPEERAEAEAFPLYELVARGQETRDLTPAQKRAATIARRKEAERQAIRDSLARLEERPEQPDPIGTPPDDFRARVYRMIEERENLHTAHGMRTRSAWTLTGRFVSVCVVGMDLETREEDRRRLEARDARQARTRADRDRTAREEAQYAAQESAKLHARKLQAIAIAERANAEYNERRERQERQATASRAARVDFYRAHKAQHDNRDLTIRLTQRTSHVHTFPRGWKRTYPQGMRLDHTDHLAVASGAYDRVCDHTGGQVVEDYSGLHFNDTDVGYLDYLRSLKTPNGQPAQIALAIAQYAETEGQGAERMGNAVYASKRQQRRPGWMYATLGTLLWYQSRRDSDSDLSQSGYDDPEDLGDNGLTSGRTWTSPETEWKPAPEDAYALRRAAETGRLNCLMFPDRKGRLTEPYLKTPSGRMDNVPGIGAIKWKARLDIHTEHGEAIALPGQWFPSPEMKTYTPWRNARPTGEIQFTDRHAWNATLYAAEELRRLLTRVIELGPDCATVKVIGLDREGVIDWSAEDDDTREAVSVDPTQWVHERLAEIMTRVPSANSFAISRQEGLPRMVAACDTLAQTIAERADGFTIPFDSLDTVTAQDIRDLHAQKRYPK